LKWILKNEIGLIKRRFIESFSGSQMKPRVIPVLEMCVENGTAVGWNRAFKHNDKPDEQEIKKHISNAIMNEIYEWFEFEELQRDLEG